MNVYNSILVYKRNIIHLFYFIKNIVKKVIEMCFYSTSMLQQHISKVSTALMMRLTVNVPLLMIA